MKSIKVKPVTKSTENELADITVSMIALMSSYFENQVIKAMNKTTVNKFQDANFSREYLTLVKKLERKIKKRFNNKRIDKLVSNVLSRVNRQNQRNFYLQLSNQLGIDTKALVLREGLKPTTNALILETSQWVKKLRDETLEQYTATTLAGMTRGEGIDEIIKNFGVLVAKNRTQAQFTAFNQSQNFNALLGKLRAQNAGIEKAVWRTSKDERVRPSHKQRDGKEFELKEGLYSSIDRKELLPGIDYRCRCFAEYILQE